ncbi:Ser/Thr protein kinase RdoA involved in Cpx stress response, MazF antagonist [Devosia sp. YR412]|uniref:phosphotransferase enzyme family protein n=1 Tax=Devosia sp. YR412 TaxID=1881030 RepID=UPI0008B00EBC|nr:phosphotransferase [Devosia sp. YR412]SEQ56844.1 Ser/Thr protein kinase RdoA involved in Cpx stress response, MazF antagonist [Devosia sp. YR412]
MPLTALEVEPALSSWIEVAGASARLINHSENQTFQIDTPANGSFTLRVHRIGYQTRPSVESELSWLMALRRDTALPIPEPVAGRDGALLQHFSTAQGDRFAVLFRHLPGGEPTPDSNLGDLFVTIGRYAATLHNHATQWQRPAEFQRQVWQASTILDADGLWGDWRAAPGVTAANRAVLDRLDATLWRRLAEYGTAPDRFGLIHADMRLGNLLVDGDTTHLIDFDDCGFCWFAYDFAAAISFHETNPAIPALKASWLEGYQAVRPLAEEDIAAIDSMVMLRRMALLAWVGSHGDTKLAQQHVTGFADGTAQLAERYLRGPIWP